MGQLIIINHPLIQHKLGIMRQASTSTQEFRQLLKEIASLMGYEVTRDLPLEEYPIETPICKTKAKRIANKKMTIVPILRAGLGLVDGLIDIVPGAKIGHIGLYRDEKTHKPVTYFCRLPADIAERSTLLVDPMLATGGSACDAIALLKERGCSQIKLMCLVAAPEGVQKVQETYPDVNIYVAAVDERLNENAYIVPGLGDAGDRIFGTK